MVEVSVSLSEILLDVTMLGQVDVGKALRGGYQDSVTLDGSLKRLEWGTYRYLHLRAACTEDALYDKLTRSAQRNVDFLELLMKNPEVVSLLGEKEYQAHSSYVGVLRSFL
jgi:hypothetical protein